MFERTRWNNASAKSVVRTVLRSAPCRADTRFEDKIQQDFKTDTSTAI